MKLTKILIFSPSFCSFSPGPSPVKFCRMSSSASKCLTANSWNDHKDDVILCLEDSVAGGGGGRGELGQ